ncbi:MAG TPA: hypothetical protein VGP08_24305 [Pyrinomonadaceae bacterium]|jgi:hypothetical protein|nr:hypothetical protein [Pyrinomonadaceae bacterium]
MADYTLEGLSTRSFEQLIQALAVKVIGPNVVVFGDGRDGGREATFEGQIPYPSKEEGWGGYGVVQAKFKQRKQDTKADGDWAIQQLRHELEDFADLEKARKKPDYYIFATNVVLTPFPEQGGKDRIAALFEEFSGSVPLKGWDVWDYDKIRVFLDGNEDIRRSYAAWITPGDVLSEVIAWLKPKQADFQRILTRYMQEELLSDQYANLEKARHASDNPIPIARVFIDLPAFDTRMTDPPEEEAEELPRGFVSELLEVASQRLDPQSLTPVRGARDEVGGSPAPEVGRFVLIGGPGQGKSTVGQFVCQLFRASLLKDRPQHLLEIDVRQALRVILTQCESEQFDLPTARRFPIRIELNSFAKELASKESPNVNSVITYVVERIRRKTNHEISVEDFRSWLGAYPWAMVFDGLDEVPPSSNRGEVLEAIRSFRIEARECNADLLIIATTRPQGYSDDFSPALYRHKWLAPLSTPRAMHYGRRLIEARYKGDLERKGKVLERLERASVQPTTARLMRSPLQVTIMATLVDRLGQPPQERWDLFRKYYNVIYDREVERGITSVLSDHRTDIDTIHKRVGILLQVESERPGESEAMLSSDEFRVVVDARLEERGHGPEESARLRREIVEAASTRLVFLVGLEENTVGFEIRSLQEFMAAEALMAGNDLDVRKRLRAIAPIANWRNVFLFAAGKCSVEREDMLDTIYMVCDEMNEDAEDEPARATLAGSQLALDLLEDIPIRQQPHDARVLARKALRLLDLPPSNLHERLAGVYDPLLEPIYREELTRRLELADPPQRLGAWACLLRLFDAGVAWAKAFDSRYWPREPAAMLDLLKVHTIVGSLSWASEKLTVLLPKLSPSEVAGQPELRELASAEIHARIPAWAVAGLDRLTGRLNRHTYFRLNLAGVQNDSFELRLVPLTSNRDSRPTELQEMPEPASGWLPLLAAERFGSSPSRFTLAQELRTIAQYFDPENKSYIAYQTAWPFSACLMSASDRAELLELAARVEAGELGDIEDWVAAEERWNSSGVTEDDLAYSSRKAGLFDEHIARRGYPFRPGSSTVSHVDSRWGVAAGLISLYEQLSEASVRKQVARWALFILGTADNEESRNALSVSTRQFRSLIESADLSSFYLVLSSLALLELESDGQTTLVDLVNDIGIVALNLYPERENLETELVRLLAEHFSKHPESVGVLRVLAELSGDVSAMLLPTELLDPNRFDNPLFKEAAVKLLLRRGRLGDKEAEATLAGQVSEVLEARPQFVGFLADQLNDLPPDASSDRLLLELQKKLPVSQWQAMGSVIAALNISLKRRNSRLDDAMVWTELNLPPKLISILQP